MAKNTYAITDVCVAMPGADLIAMQRGGSFQFDAARSAEVSDGIIGFDLGTLNGVHMLVGRRLEPGETCKVRFHTGKGEREIMVSRTK